MTLLSRKADYALLILWVLHQSDKGHNARTIAEQFQLSRSFVANILKELCQKGFVASQRGIRGGYSLNRPCSEISLLSLLEAMDERFRVALCNSLTNESECNLQGICPLRDPLGDLHRRMLDLFASITLSELYGKNPPPQMGQRLPLVTTNTVVSTGCQAM